MLVLSLGMLFENGIWIVARRRVGWAKRKRAHQLASARAVVGTAQGRLCPPYATAGSPSPRSSRGEGWGEGLHPRARLVESPPHPPRCARRPLPACGARREFAARLERATPSTNAGGLHTFSSVPPRLSPALPEPAAALLPDRFEKWFAARGWAPRAHQLALL
jgi:hypothetical protein